MPVDVNIFLGIQIIQKKERIFIHQYISCVLDKYNISESVPVKIPMEESYILEVNHGF